MIRNMDHTFFTSYMNTIIWFTLCTSLVVPGSGAAHISSHRDNRDVEPKKGQEQAVFDGHHGANPSLPVVQPQPGFGSQPKPQLPVEPDFGIGDPRHPYNPHYNPDEHFKHYPDFRIANENQGEVDTLYRGFKPTWPTKRPTSTAETPSTVKQSDPEQNAGPTTQRPVTTTKPDWEYVCYVLCGANQGGIACRCDILPIG